jgi:DNA mismatch repair protein MutL
MSKEGELLTLLKQSINQAIRKSMIVPSAVKKEPAPKNNSEQVSIWNDYRTHQPSTRPEKPLQVNEAPFHRSFLQDAKAQEDNVSIAPPDNQFQEEVVPDTSFEEQPELATESTKKFPSLVPVGQVHGTYIIAQNEDGFYMIDQHAAQERIKYEFFHKKLAVTNSEERQLLLLPLLFHYSGDEKTKIEENMDKLEEVGIYLEEFGPSSYTVKEYPSWFPAGEETTIIEDIIEQVLHTYKTDIGKLREDAAIMMSCKKSIKANHHLTIADMERLLEDLSQMDNPFTCPHGRPVLIHFTTYELEKMFKRVM